MKQTALEYINSIGHVWYESTQTEDAALARLISSHERLREENRARHEKIRTRSRFKRWVLAVIGEGNL